MATKIRLYGSTSITPGDIPTGVVPDRANIVYLWQGCLGNCPKPQYNPPILMGSPNTSSWSFGGYGSNDLMNVQNSNEDIRTFIQDEKYGAGGFANPTGWNSFLNNNAINKRLLAAQVGTDIPSGSVIEYVRVWVRCGAGTKTNKYLQPYWQQIFNESGNPDNAGSAQWPAVDSGKDWDTTTHFVCRPNRSSHLDIQSSSKWTTVPITGETWNAALMERLAWGVRHGKKGTEGQPSNVGDPGFHGVSELMIEVGYDAAADYDVTTLAAVGVTGTEATLQGLVDQKADQGGDYFFQYGTTEALGTETGHNPQLGTGEAYNTSANIAGLASDTLYFYRAAATDSNGLEHYGEILTFLTVIPCSTRASLIGG